MTAIPGYWLNEQSGVLKPVVLKYLDRQNLDPDEVATMRAYLRQWINGEFHGPGIGRLRADVEKITTSEDVHDWLEYALDVGIDPL